MNRYLIRSILLFYDTNIAAPGWISCTLANALQDHEFTSIEPLNLASHIVTVGFRDFPVRCMRPISG